MSGQRHTPAALPPGNIHRVPTIVQEAGWAPGPVWTGAENLAPTGIRSPDRPARSDSLYRLSYRGPQQKNCGWNKCTVLLTLTFFYFYFHAASTYLAEEKVQISAFELIQQHQFKRTTHFCTKLSCTSEALARKSRKFMKKKESPAE